VYDPGLGSRFYELKKACKSSLESAALTMAHEALWGMRNIRAVSADVLLDESGEPAAVRLKLNVYNTEKEVEIEI